MFEYDTNRELLSIGTREAFWVREGEVIKVSDTRAECAGPTRGSVENNSPVMLARLPGDSHLAGQDLNRPVSFLSPLDPTLPNPNREV